MPTLLGGAVPTTPSSRLSPTRFQYITLNQTQAALGATPTGNTGYTLVVGANGQATFTNTLGQLAFSTGTITSQAPGGNITITPTGTGTITLNGPVNIPQGIIGNGFKAEINAASTTNVTVNTSTSTVVYDNYHLNYLDRLLVRANANPAENGIYFVITATFNTGTTVTNAITLVRSSDANTTRQISHAAFPVISGTTYAGNLFFSNFTTQNVLDQDPLIILEFINDVTTQAVANKDLENSVIGQSIPRAAQFTIVTASNLSVATLLTATGIITLNGNVTMAPTDQNILIQPSGTGTVIVNPGNAGSIDNINIGSNTPKSGVFTNLQATTQIFVASTTNSTSTTTGAVVVTGGVGIGKNLTIGGNLSLAGAGGQAGGNIAAGNISATNLTVSGQAIFSTTTNSTSTTTGGLVIAGGVGIAQDLVLGGQLIFSGQAGALRVATLAITSSSQSTSTTTGALTVAGGAGIGGNLVLGGQLIFSGQAGGLVASTLVITSTTNSTSTTTGAVQVAGGVGVGGNLVVGGQLIFQGTGSNLSVQTLAVTSTTNSVSSTTGALTVAGGVGIAQDVYVGGNLDLFGSLTFNKSFTATFVSLHVTSTASDTANFTNNAVYIEGGLSTKKDLSVYGNTIISGNLTVLGTQTIVDSQNTYVIDPVIDIGTGIDNTPLSTNDGFDRGMLLHYNTGVTTATDNHAFLGRDASTGYLVYKTNIYPGGYETFAPSFTSTGSFGVAQFAGLRLSGGTNAISSNTGDLQVIGGIGVAGNSYITGKVTLANTAANTTQTLNHALIVSQGGIGVASDSYFGGTLRIGLATGSSSPTTGALQVQGGVGINANLSVGGPVQIYAATSASSTGTGALIVGGGIGANGDIYCHKLFTDAGQTQLSNFNGGTISDPLKVANSTSATSTSTGALTVNGGVGIGGSLYVGGSINAQILYSGGSQVLTTSTPTGFDGGLIHYPLIIGDYNNPLNTTALTLNAPVESYNTQSGSLITYGGIGAGMSIHLGGTLSREGDWATNNWAGSGVALNLPSALYYDNTGIGTYPSIYATFIDVPTFDAKLTTVYNTASTVYIGGAPLSNGPNVRIGTAYSLYVNSGTVFVGTTATSTVTQTATAFQIVGGLAVGQDLIVGNNIVAGQIYDTNNRVITSVSVTAGTGLSGGGTAFGPGAALTLTNTGVLSNTAGLGINVSNTTGNVVISNTGVLSATAGTGININTATGNVVVANIGVTSITGAGSISVSTSTGSVIISSLDTLQDVTSRGPTTNRTITFTSTGTGVNVINNVTIGGTLNVGSTTTLAVLSAGTSTLGSTIINGTAVITGNLTVQGTQTTVNSTQTALIDPVIDLGTGINNTPLTGDDGYDKGLLIHYNTGASIANDNHAFLGMEHASRKLTFRTNIYPGGTENVPNPYSSTGSVAGAIFSDLQLLGGIASTGPNTGDLQVAGGIGITGNSTFAGQVKFNNTVTAFNTQTGAVQVAGGMAVAKDLVIGGNLILDGFLLSTASNFNGGTITKDLVVLSGTTSTNSQTGAIVLGGQGGIGVGGNANVGGYVNASAFYQNGVPLSTNISLALGPGLSGGTTTTASGITIALTNTGLTNLAAGTGISLSTTSGALVTITNIGVTGITVGTGIGAIGYVEGATTSTGTVNIVNLGVTSAIGGTAIGVSQSTGSVTINNLGVTSITKVGNGLTISTSTGSVFMVNSGVTSLTGGTDTYVTAATGDIVVYTYSTLQSVTDHGNATNNIVFFNNTSTATSISTGSIVVAGGIGVADSVYAGNSITALGNATIYGSAQISNLSINLDSITGLLNDAVTLNSQGPLGSVSLTSGPGRISVQQGAINLVSSTISANGIVSLTNTATSTSTTTGALVVTGGVGIGNNLTVNGTINALGGYLGLNPSKIFQSTSSVTVIDTGTAVQQVFVSIAGTTSTQFLADRTNINVPLYAPNINSTGTISRTGTVTAGAWGLNGIGITNIDATYQDTNSSGVVGAAHINVFGQPTLSVQGANPVTYNDVATMYIKNSPVAGNGNTTILRPWSLYVASGKVYVGDATASVSPTTGALTVSGGVGISGNINVNGNANINGSILNVGNSEIYTYTSPSITSSGQVGLDSFAVSAYQSAKYFIQVVDNTGAGQPNLMYVTELIVYHDGNGQVYISEYGMASNTGDLGTFDAAITGGNVLLEFTPNYTPYNMIIKLSRTSLSR